MDANVWIAIATIFTAIGTAALAIITGFLARFAKDQISSALGDAKIGRTLAVCEKYDLDPQLGCSVVRLRNVRESNALHDNPDEYYNDIVSVLNYFESIAIGVERDLYDETMVQDHFCEIFQAHYSSYFSKEAPEEIRENWFIPSDFTRFKRICSRWTQGTRNPDEPK